MKRHAEGLGPFFVLLAALAAGCSGAGETDGDGETVGSATQRLCSSVAVTSNDADYSLQPGPIVRWTATPNCSGGTPQYYFTLLRPDGTWITSQDWSTSNTYDWPTSGLPTGRS